MGFLKIVISQIKTIIRGFELASSLSVNFNKRKIVGINMNSNFPEATMDFLSCSVTHLPFTFLGIPIGANPRRRAIWELILSIFWKRINSWNGRFNSYGSIVILLNSIFNSLSLFYFSFI